MYMSFRYAYNRNDVRHNRSTLFGKGDPTELPGYYVRTPVITLPEKFEVCTLTPADAKTIQHFWELNDDDVGSLKERYSNDVKRLRRSRRPSFKKWVPINGPVLTWKEQLIQRGAVRKVKVFNSADLNGLLFRAVDAEVGTQRHQNAGVIAMWTDHNGAARDTYGMILSILKAQPYEGADGVVLLEMHWLETVHTGTVCVMICPYIFCACAYFWKCIHDCSDVHTLCRKSALSRSSSGQSNWSWTSSEQREVFSFGQREADKCHVLAKV